MSAFTTQGLVIDTVTETQSLISASLKTAHGADFKSDDPQSIAGQDVAIISGAIREQNELILGLAEMFSPNAAKGFFLANLVLFNGITKKEARKSTVSVDVTAGTAASNIFAGDIVTDANDSVEWLIDANVSLAIGETKTVSATAKEDGAFAADPGTITKIKTPRYSWEAVTNSAAASPGRTEETDPDLRNRRSIASKQTGQTSEPAIFRDLTEIEGVESVNTYINETGVVDPVTGQLPGWIWCIIRGGSDQAIGKVLTDSISGGVLTFGTVSVVYTDINVDQNGVEYSKDYTRRFDRPEDIPTYIDIILTKDSNYPAEGDTIIRQAIIDYYRGSLELNGLRVPGFAIGKPVVHSRLYSPVNTVQGHSITGLYVNLGTFGAGTADIPMERNQQAFVNASLIRINGAVGS